MRALTAVLAVTLLSLPLEAQDVTLGDQVRVRGNADSAWSEGRLMAKSDSTLSVAHGTERVRYELGQLQADHWNPNSPVVSVLAMSGGSALGWYVAGASGDESDAWFTGSAGADVAAAAGVGAAIGALMWASNPGDWEKWIR